METENKKIIPIIAIAVLFIMTALFFATWWFTRDKPLLITIAYYVVIMIILGIILMIVLLVIWLFKTKRKDMLWIAKQRIIKACESCPPNHEQKLYLRGESLLESRFVGFVQGICQVSGSPLRKITRDKDTGIEKLDKYKDSISENLFIIAFKKANGFISSFLSPTELIIGTKEDFSNFNGDIIYIYDMCFAPKLYDMLIPSKHYKHTHLLDEPVKDLIYRYNLQENLVETREIASAYLSISPEYQKQKASSHAQELGLLRAQLNNQGNQK